MTPPTLPVDTNRLLLEEGDGGLGGGLNATEEEVESSPAGTYAGMDIVVLVELGPVVLSFVEIFIVLSSEVVKFIFGISNSVCRGQ